MNVNFCMNHAIQICETTITSRQRQVGTNKMLTIVAVKFAEVLVSGGTARQRLGADVAAQWQRVCARLARVGLQPTTCSISSMN